jgi:hypothetical protein
LSSSPRPESGREGWQVVITDAEGKSYQVAEFDHLLAA